MISLFSQTLAIDYNLILTYVNLWSLNSFGFSVNLFGFGSTFSVLVLSKLERQEAFALFIKHNS